MKPHSQARHIFSTRSCGRSWMELDSSASSDALLMNVFCYPRVFSDGRLGRLLGVEIGSVPDFGVKARVPLVNNQFDRTEVDMRIGKLLVEAKLCEIDFQCKSCGVLDGYRDFATVFDQRLLVRRKDTPRANQGGFGDSGEPTLAVSGLRCRAPTLHDDKFLSYQLIRNVLGAYAMDCSFCVLHDARRPDLREAWYAVMRAIRNAEMRTRCLALTWQELSSTLPPKLRRFLKQKYGIHDQGPAGD